MSDMEQRIEQNKSMFNPTDVAMMKQDGQLDAQKMSVRGLLEKFGIDVEGPASQLIDFFKSQRQKGSMAGKIQSLGGGQPAPQGQPRMPQGRRPMTGGGMERILNY